MTSALNTIIIDTTSKKKPKNAVILCHGYGGDGKDISILASYWKAQTPETVFICPRCTQKLM
jgi:Predicted esterase